MFHILGGASLDLADIKQEIIHPVRAGISEHSLMYFIWVFLSEHNIEANFQLRSCLSPGRQTSKEKVIGFPMQVPNHLLKISLFTNNIFSALK